MLRPEEAARYRRREFWFWSRRLTLLRNSRSWKVPAVPRRWRPCAGPLATGEVRSPDPRRGLLTLARMLSAGWVTPPWRLGQYTVDPEGALHRLSVSYADELRPVDLPAAA